MKIPVSGRPRNVVVLHVNVFNVEAVTEKSDRKWNEQEKKPVSGPVQNHVEKRHFSRQVNSSNRWTGKADRLSGQRVEGKGVGGHC